LDDLDDAENEREDKVAAQGHYRDLALPRHHRTLPTSARWRATILGVMYVAESGRTQ
jgi:hypothetical protein